MPSEPAAVERNTDDRDSLGLLFRRQSGQMVATLTRIFGWQHLDLVEDVVQETFVTAVRQWPFRGAPDNPRAWLLEVAKNRARDVLRRQGRWRDKQEQLERGLRAHTDPAAAWFRDELRDDQLRLVFACCDPRINRSDQVALILRTVGGMSAGEIARAFVQSESAVAQRLVRAKHRLRAEGPPEFPPPSELPLRLDAVLEAIYLMFNEGHDAHSGEDLVRADLCAEAIRLGELIAAHPTLDQPEVRALLSLLCLQGARLGARCDAAGQLLLLEEQDRDLWDRALIRRGLAHLQASAYGDRLTDYHLQAEIACCHAIAPAWEDTDWDRILDAYDRLFERARSPIVALNRIVALAQVAGPENALADLERRTGEIARPLDGYYPFHATRGRLLHDLGRHAEAASSYRRAWELARSAPVREFLKRRLRVVSELGDGARGESAPSSGQPLRARVASDPSRSGTRPGGGS